MKEKSLKDGLWYLPALAKSITTRLQELGFDFVGTRSLGELIELIQQVEGNGCGDKQEKVSCAASHDCNICSWLQACNYPELAELIVDGETLHTYATEEFRHRLAALLEADFHGKELPQQQAAAE